MSKTTKKPLNGSVDLLAEGIRNVFNEGFTSVRDGVKADIADMENRLIKQIDDSEGRLMTEINAIRADVKSVGSKVRGLDK